MHTVVSLNVDYAANGPGHLDRAVCRVTLATAGAVVHDLVVRVPALRDPITAYTGLVAEDFETAVELETAIEMTRRELEARTDVLLIGHGLARAARAMQLSAGKEYRVGVDLIEQLRTWNRRFEHWNYYALPKICFVTGAGVPRDSRDRALAMLAVYEYLVGGPFMLSGVKQRLQQLQYGRGFPPAVAAKPEAPEGVCVWAYRDDLCVCGQPTLGGPAPGGQPADAPKPNEA
jgi:hypothetical protein